MNAEKTRKTAKKSPKYAKSDGKSAENTQKSGKIFGEWTFERLEVEFGLKGRQAIFVARYAAHEVGKRAAIEAGYTEKSADHQACMLLKDIKVSQAVAALLKAKRDNIAEACGITAEFVIGEFARIAAYCGEVVEKKNSEGDVTGTEMNYPDGALRAMESLGKIAGLFVAKTKTELKAELEHSGSVRVQHVLEFGDPGDDFSDIPGG